MSVNLTMTFNTLILDLPELKVSSISITPMTVYQGDNVQIVAVVTNIGRTAATNVQVKIWARCERYHPCLPDKFDHDLLHRSSWNPEHLGTDPLELGPFRDPDDHCIGRSERAASKYQVVEDI